MLPDAAADWQAILKDGKLVVGAAVDYPPFEFYDPSFQIDGFDPALARAIGTVSYTHLDVYKRQI